MDEKHEWAFGPSRLNNMERAKREHGSLATMYSINHAKLVKEVKV